MYTNKRPDFLLIKGLYDFYSQVCSEETMIEILNRYLLYNTHAASYTWKYNGEFYTNET